MAAKKTTEETAEKKTAEKTTAEKKTAMKKTAETTSCTISGLQSGMPKSLQIISRKTKIIRQFLSIRRPRD